MNNGTLQWQTEYGLKTEAIRESLSESAEWGLLDQCCFSQVLEPGDGTHYEVFGVFKTVRDSQPLFYIGFMTGTWAGGSSIMPMKNWLHRDYVAEKLKITNLHSANILADFLNLLIERSVAWES